MKSAQAFTDKFSIGLSMLCAIHCLFLPFILVLLPSIAAMQLEHETFHKWMVYAVLPTSLYALTAGCKKHKQYQLLLLGGAGLTLMVLAISLGHDTLGEVGEKILTVSGAILVAAGHFLNFKLCKKHNACVCTEKE